VSCTWSPTAWGTPSRSKIVGAPYLNGEALSDALNEHWLNPRAAYETISEKRADLPEKSPKPAGVYFRSVRFKPFYATFAKEVCQGVQVHIDPKRAETIVEINYRLMEAIGAKKILEEAPKRHDMFDKVNGSDEVRTVPDGGEGSGRAVREVEDAVRGVHGGEEEVFAVLAPREAPPLAAGVFVRTEKARRERLHRIPSVRAQRFDWVYPRCLARGPEAEDHAGDARDAQAQHDADRRHGRGPLGVAADTGGEGVAQRDADHAAEARERRGLEDELALGCPFAAPPAPAACRFPSGGRTRWRA
jgi:hypothetical protein